MRLGTPHLFSLSLLLSAVLMGCAPKEDDAFGAGGVDNNTTDLPCDDCDTATTETTDTVDTAETADDGWPESEDNGGPSQRDADCYFEDFPNIGMHIVCEMEVRDQEGNLDGGKLNLEISGGVFGENYELVEDVDSLEDPTCVVCLDGDEVKGARLFFAIPQVESSDNYDLVWTLKDKGGNESNELEARVD